MLHATILDPALLFVAGSHQIPLAHASYFRTGCSTFQRSTSHCLVMTEPRMFSSLMCRSFGYLSAFEINGSGYTDTIWQVNEPRHLDRPRRQKRIRPETPQEAQRP
jgi:hypothetical protein